MRNVAHGDERGGVVRAELIAASCRPSGENPWGEVQEGSSITIRGPLEKCLSGSEAHQ
jgi:hypothetical protein